jgi:arylsulfatase A-like enzyme
MRSALLLFAVHHGVQNNLTPWDNTNTTLFEPLHKAGYEPAFIGKWHMPGGLPKLRGLDHYEESIRIPLLLRYPNRVRQTNRKLDQMVLNIDLAPTLLDLAGIKQIPPMDGGSMVP